MPLTIPWGAFHIVQRHAHTFISLLSDSHKEDTKREFVRDSFESNAEQVSAIQDTQRTVEMLLTQSDDRVPDVLVVRRDSRQMLGDEGMSRSDCLPVCDGESCVNSSVGDPNQHGMTPQTDSERQGRQSNWEERQSNSYINRGERKL